LLEVPFDLLMSAASKKILGKHAGFFGKEFPIRFDFLDTWEGGNLSIQCHPSLKYIRQQFGEHITQDETYYILDCKPGAKVYLGFQEGVQPAEFKKVLENSKTNGEEIKIEEYVQAQAAHKHDLFLIPNGTIHSAGADNLVLEISSTPYIFTFKMYDWLRLDLNGEPRAINIEHAYNNLRFDRQGSAVKEELVSQPKLIEQGTGFEVWHLPTHAEHFYDVHRLEFDKEVKVNTDDSCNVLMLVEGSSILVKIGENIQQFHYAETFVIPAAVNNYTIINEGKERAKVVKAFIKNSIDHLKQ
jgi:mannose-6-phosphate isomerase class I